MMKPEQVDWFIKFARDNALTNKNRYKEHKLPFHKIMYQYWVKKLKIEKELKQALEELTNE